MSTSDKSCYVSASKLKSNDDGVCDVIGKLQNMSTADEEIALSVCANCGKEGDDINNTCNKCKMVKYCNAVCKKVHKKKHKEECEAYQRRATEKHDEKLFKQPPPQFGDCPICFIRMPSLETGWGYYSCCGKVICSGCAHAPLYDNQGNEVDNQKCPFCRTPKPTSNEEAKEREKERMKVNDPIAIYNLGYYYEQGKYGYTQDYAKALEYWHRSAELGYSPAYCSIGFAYQLGQGVERDEKKGNHYTELAAMMGSTIARDNLAITEERLARENLGNIDESIGNIHRALKHHTTAVGGGYSQSLNKIKEWYQAGLIEKKNYTKALQLYQTYLGEIKSDQRDKAAAFSEEMYRYY